MCPASGIKAPACDTDESPSRPEAFGDVLGEMDERGEPWSVDLVGFKTAFRNNADNFLYAYVAEDTEIDAYTPAHFLKGGPGWMPVCEDAKMVRGLYDGHHVLPTRWALKGRIVLNSDYYMVV